MSVLLIRLASCASTCTRWHAPPSTSSACCSFCWLARMRRCPPLEMLLHPSLDQSCAARRTHRTTDILALFCRESAQGWGVGELQVPAIKRC
eukprot:1168527-Pleurochrysis_carterae.AAC.2